MSLKRKRTRELKRLRESAEELWRDQQALMDRANVVAKEAKRQATSYSREELAPRVRDGYEQYVRPRLDDARGAARFAGERLERTLVPAIGSALGTVLSVADVAQDARVKAAARRLGGAVTSKKTAAKASGPGAGTYVAIGFAAAAAAGLAYAVWQTFRADDELWVADDEPVPPASSDTPAAE